MPAKIVMNVDGAPNFNRKISLDQPKSQHLHRRPNPRNPSFTSADKVWSVKMSTMMTMKRKEK
ncbi:hypothetical protein Hanom_Chr11g00982241 [Helianthus anomalus]